MWYIAWTFEKSKPQDVKRKSKQYKYRKRDRYQNCPLLSHNFKIAQNYLIWFQNCLNTFKKFQKCPATFAKFQKCPLAKFLSSYKFQRMFKNNHKITIWQLTMNGFRLVCQHHQDGWDVDTVSAMVSQNRKKWTVL